MSQFEQIIVPLLNPNETEAKLIDLSVKEGQKLAKGDLLGTLETTKSTFELLAPMAGFVHGLNASEGDLLPAGETFCYLADSKDWQAPKRKPSKKGSQGAALPTGLRITQPALKLAQQEELEINNLPIGPLLTEDLVRRLLSNSAVSDEVLIPDGVQQKNAILVYGGGGHGKAVIELIKADGRYAVIGIIDDGLSVGDFVLGVPILGNGKYALPALKEAGCNLAINAVGGIGAIDSRINVFEQLESAGFESPALIHPSAVLEESARLSPAVQIFPHAYVGSAASIAKGVIVNTAAIVSHDCQIEQYANIAPGAILAGGVSVAAGSLIGMGVTINLNVKIGERARIGNSATVKSDLPAKAIVRAGTIWPQ